MNKTQIYVLFLYLIINITEGSFLFPKSSSSSAKKTSGNGNTKAQANNVMHLNTQQSTSPTATIGSSAKTSSTYLQQLQSSAKTTIQSTSSPILKIENTAAITTLAKTSVDSRGSTLSSIDSQKILTSFSSVHSSATTDSNKDSSLSLTSSSFDKENTIKGGSSESKSSSINTESLGSSTATDAKNSATGGSDGVTEVNGGLVIGNQTAQATTELSTDTAVAIIIEPNTQDLITQLKKLQSMGRPKSSDLLKWADGIVPNDSESAYIAYSKSLATMCDIIMNEYSSFGKCLSSEPRFKNFDSGFWYSSIKFLCYYTGNTQSTKTFQLHNTVGSMTMEIAPSVASMMINVGDHIPFSSLYSGEKLDVQKTTDYLLSLRVKHLESKGLSSNVAELNTLNQRLGVSTLKKRILGLSYLGSQLLSKSVPDIQLCHQFESRTNEVSKCSMTVQYARLSAICELGFFVKDSASILQASTILANPSFSKAIKAYLNEMDSNSTIAATKTGSSNSTSENINDNTSGTTETSNSVTSGTIQGDLVVYNSKELKLQLSNIKNSDGLTTSEILEFSKDVVNVTGQYYYDRYSRVFAELCEDTIGLLHPFGECLKQMDTYLKYNGTMWAKAFTYDYCGAYDTASKNFKANFFHLQIPQTAETQLIYVPPNTVSALLNHEKTTSFDSLMNSDGSANGGKTGDFLIGLNNNGMLNKRLFGLDSLMGISGSKLTIPTSCKGVCEKIQEANNNSTILNCWGEATANLAYHGCISVCTHFHLG